MAKATTPTTITPSDLAKELDVNPKALRNYLRSNFGRSDEAKRSRWEIDKATADKVRKHYADKATGTSDDSDES